MTKLSIIVPFHNVEAYISKCLTSLIYQTLKDIEIIMINDASTDGSKEIAETYKQNDSRIILLNTDEQVGQSTARNMGLNAATGDYIGFVDADDWGELDMFEKMYNRAISDYTDITMCLANLYDDKEQTTSSNDYYNLKCLSNMGEKIFNAKDTVNEILNINVVLWNKIYRRLFLQNINAKFPEGYIYEDLPFFYQTYLKAEKVNILWENLYYYRQNRISSTMQNSDKKVYDRIPMVKKTYEILQQAPFFQEKKTDIISWIIDDIFHRYTLLEDKYYEDYYPQMQEFFRSIELSEEDKEKLAQSYCYDEFCNIRERSYYGFWNFLIEKYRTSNKLIKDTKHECNKSIAEIKEYMEQYKQEVTEWCENKCKEEAAWWDNKCKEEIAWWENHYSEDMNQLAENMHEKIVKQEYELKAWQADSVRQVREKITADYEWKLAEQKRHYEDSLQNQKYYYENNYFLVKIVLKICRKIDKIKNQIKKIMKKN